MPKALPGYSEGRLQEEARKRKVGKKEKANKGRRKKKKIEEGIRSSRRMAFERQNPIQRWDSSQIESEEEEEESWQEGDQMARQCEEEQHLDDWIERRRMEGSSLKSDVMQKVPELVVNKRMSQGKNGKDTKEKKNLPGWSIEEMKVRPNIAVEEDTEEMKRWRSLNQCEMDPCWKNLAERVEEEVLDKYKVEESN